MPVRTRHYQTPALSRRLRGGWRTSLPRLLVLAALLLLPVQMRSGATQPHPHALLQALLDLSDGTIDHHADGHHGAAAPAPHSTERAAPRANDPDTPSFEAPSPAASGTSLLAALVLLLIVPAQDPRPAWPRSAIRMGHHPGVEPPPPRVPIR